MPFVSLTLRATSLAFLAVAGRAHAESGFPPDQIEFFETLVRPLLVENCLDCHGAARQKSGLRLDSRDAVLRGSDFNKVVVPGDPEASLLMKAVRHVANVEPMPSRKPALDPIEVEALAKWVRLGLPWPAESPPVAESKPRWQDHWAFQPVKKPALPGLAKLGSQVSNPIDTFVAAKLERAGLDFAPTADAATLCRRLFLDLTGLPPAFEDVVAFGNDRSPGALANLVSRLLDSPRYGERWARHWLDLARYSDTEGYRAGGVDIRFPHAFTYRDWVVAALNADMPYDRFVTCQLAADRLPPSESPASNLAALGFLTINDSFLGDRSLQIDDRIDVVSRGLLGLTMGCARCHDHKFDPVPSKDYYALYSVFNSCEQPDELPIIGASADPGAAAAFQRKVAAVDAKMRAFRREVIEDTRKPDRLKEYLAFAHDHRDDPGGAFGGAAGKAKLRDRIAARWRDFLKRHALSAKPNTVMLPWKEFARLPAAEFAARAAEVSQRLARPESGVNGVARHELARCPPPKTMGDVASLYAEIFLAALSGAAPDNDDWMQVRSLLKDPTCPMAVPEGDAGQFFTRRDHEHMTRFENEIKKIEIDEPGAPLRAMVLNDTAQPRDVRVFIRGNPARLGEPAPRAYPAFLGGQKFTSGSGRLELAKAIASRDNPLAARVLVNRVWLDHFGRPLVSQPSDFGVQTPRPEHAELLDYLAATFMEKGWSLKTLHRLIVTSRTYRQACVITPEKEIKDADNNLLSRFNRNRLDFESMRDAVLASSGSLRVANAGGRSTPLGAPFVDTRRSIYLFVDRYEQPTVPAMFDFANPDRHSPQRFVTTVPQQALFLMNSPFIRAQSEKLAAGLDLAADSADARSVSSLYRRVLQRDPSPDETGIALRFLADARRSQVPAFKVLTDARRDFCGPGRWPLNRTRPQPPLAQLAQVLLMSNEFQFVD